MPFLVQAKERAKVLVVVPTLTWIGTDKVELVARVATGDERERIWSAQKAAYPNFADYERKTTRQIPVVVLEPATSATTRI